MPWGTLHHCLNVHIVIEATQVGKKYFKNIKSLDKNIRVTV
jgi:hypothetical protein